MDVGAAWAVVAGVLIASTGPFVTGYFERKARRDERREIDQRATLHAVQDDMYRLTGAASTRLMLTAEGSWPHQNRFATGELMREFADASSSLVRYGQRIRDDNAREALFRYHIAVKASLEIDKPQAAEPAMQAILDKYSTAQTAVGIALRKL